MSRFDKYNEELKVEEIKQDVERDKVEITCKDDEEDERKYDFHTIRSEVAYKQAADEGNVVILPGPDQLLIDIDSPEAEAVYNKNLPKFQMHVATVLKEERKVSRNGNTHIYVTLDQYVDQERRILFQAFLGSDQTRELLSYIRTLNDDPNPTLFIEKPTLLLGDGNGE